MSQCDTFNTFRQANDERSLEVAHGKGRWQASQPPESTRL